MRFEHTDFNWARTCVMVTLFTIVMMGVGCDKTVVKAKPTAVRAETTNRSAGPEPIIFETDESKEQQELIALGSKLLEAHDFDELEKVAHALRASKAEFPNGYWKLGRFAAGFSGLPLQASESRWTNLFEHLKLWVKAKPDSITARTALGWALREYAWKARGTGWANTVTPSAWKLFHARLAESRETLLSATNSPEKCPLWFSSLLGVGLGEGWPRPMYDRVFAAGTNFLPGFAPIYFVKCYHLLPRWHGAAGEWEQFASDAADEFGGDEGDVLYARIAWAMHENRVYTNMFRESKLSWPRTKRGFLLLQERYPDSISLTSEFCCLAGVARDRVLMKELFAKLEGRVDLSVWKDKARFIRDRQWAFSK